ncbi:MAG: hypothetical protein JNN32_07790 [Flavobacteriales bacterium]|nr:hypothetical protein [Flavobacteriales bacterium]
MELQRIWNAPHTQDDQPLRPIASGQHSRHPLFRLQRALRINMVYGVVITAVMGYLSLRAEEVPLMVLFWMITAFCAWSLVDTWRLARGLDTMVRAERSTLDELRYQRDAFDRWMRVQQRAGWFFYPISVVAGGLLGALAGGEQPFDVLIGDPRFLLLLGVLAVIFSPLCAWLARWMFCEAFGREVDHLRGAIEDLEG